MGILLNMKEDDLPILPAKKKKSGGGGGGSGRRRRREAEEAPNVTSNVTSDRKSFNLDYVCFQCVL